MSRTKDISKILKKEFHETISLKKLKKKQLLDISEIIIVQIKDSVRKGKSPIHPGKRFEKYKNPEKYPGKLKKKRPVNLHLSGDFLKNLKALARVGLAPRMTIGFFDKKSILKEKGHRERANGQPSRPIIPTRKEEFARFLRRKFLDSVVEYLNKVF